MIRFYATLSITLIFAARGFSQQFLPVGTTGYKLDAIAENTTAAATTGGAIDGSDYVLYSQAYGALFSSSYGLPNNGIIAASTRTYQLQPYNQANMLYLLPGQTDSLIFTFPVSFGGVSLLLFGTEGNPNMVTTLRFTDNSTMVNPSQSVPDWFGSGNTVISGFDRCGRTSGTPNFQSGQPKMYYQDIVIPCASRSKPVQNIKIWNSGTSGRLCVMAVAYATTPVFSPTTIPVNCPNGKNGSANIIPTGGVAPFSYTVNSQPAQTTGTPVGLPVGVYSYTAQDVAACAVTGTFAITSSFVPQPALSVTANFYTICAGANVALNTSGANSYTWNSVPGGAAITVTPQSSIVYTVNGTTAANCAVTGTVAIQVNPNPVVNFTLPATMCANEPCLTLAATPGGGNYNGLGVSNGKFCVSGLAVNKTYSITYSYTDANFCSASGSVTTMLYPAPVVSFFLDPLSYCVNSSTVNLSGIPPGGSFIGNGTSGSVFTPSAAGPGNSAITYSYTDQNGCSKTASVNVIVNPLPKVTFALSKSNYCVNAPLVPLNASPSTGTYTGKGITSQFFSPSLAGAGTHTITYSYTDVSNCTASAFATVAVSACTGVNELAGNDIKIWPNPSAGAITIEVYSAGELNICNELGQIVYNTIINADEKTVDVNGLADGIYTVVIRTQEGIVTRRICVNK